jgi:hypothetical protein
MLIWALKKLDLTWEFNEVRLKGAFGWRNLQGFGTVKFLLVSSDQREDLKFSATMPKAKF